MPRRSSFVRAIAAAALAFTLVPSAAVAQSWMKGEIPEQRFVHRNSLFLRLNPLGFIHDGRFMYRHRLYHSESAALRDNFVAIGVSPSLSPAFGRIGAYVEVQPASVLTLHANYEGVAYLGGFNYLQSYQSPLGADFSDDRLSEEGKLPAGDARKNYATVGTQLTLGANFQIKLGPVVVRSMFRAVRGDYALRNDDRVYYDVIYDVLAPNRGWFFTNDADLLWQGDLGPDGQQLTLGVRHTWTTQSFGPEHFAPGESTATNPVSTMHRVGPLLSYAFAQKDGEGWNAPSLVIGAQWWLSHQYRTQNPLIPLFLVGFSVNGDLMRTGSATASAASPADPIATGAPAPSPAEASPAAARDLSAAAETGPDTASDPDASAPSTAAIED